MLLGLGPLVTSMLLKSKRMHTTLEREAAMPVYDRECLDQVAHTMKILKWKWTVRTQ